MNNRYQVIIAKFDITVILLEISAMMSIITCHRLLIIILYHKLSTTAYNNSDLSITLNLIRKHLMATVVIDLHIT